MAQNLAEFIQELKDEGALRTPRIIAAYKEIDRKDFVRHEDREMHTATAHLS